ncbi:hypothetical protein HMPREF0352_1747 [Enterococcus faecium TX1330]|nr:hypothetical protein HMPREF0352_1747 [Enterococcus faecium TX1330]MBL5006285.1 hypothetical protein [Enterococcus lactis]
MDVFLRLFFYTYNERMMNLQNCLFSVILKSGADSCFSSKV